MKRPLKIISTILVVIVVGLIALIILGQAGFASVRGIYTRMGVEHYERCRMEAITGDLAQGAQSLKEVVEYWPSKVPRTGDYAYIIETFRGSVTREIIARMRELSGEDLGDNPTDWIGKYSKSDEDGG